MLYGKHLVGILVFWVSFKYPVLFRDLRGNQLNCDCDLKWLVDWMYYSNATVDPTSCSSPVLLQGKMVTDLVPQSFDCITAGASFL